MTLLWPWVLTLLPLPWLAAGLRARFTTHTALRLPDPAILPVPLTTSLAGRPSAAPGRVGLRAALIWGLLVLAATRPVAPEPDAGAPVSGRELMIALDVSLSMSTRDLEADGQPVTRLHAARALARDFVSRRHGDRVGLIVFGSQAYLHTPLTFDVAAITQSLADAEIGLAGEDTALGDAIALAAKRVDEFKGSERALILLTDGANTAGKLSPEQAGWLAQRANLRLHIVGIGAEQMRIADAQGVRTINPSADLDEPTLQALAQQSGGSYHRATDTQALAAFYRQIEEIEPIRDRNAALRPPTELYVWPLGLALIIVALDTARRQLRKAPWRRHG